MHAIYSFTKKRVSTVEESEEYQKTAFKLGFEWCTHENKKEVKNTDKEWLFFGDGIIFASDDENANRTQWYKNLDKIGDKEKSLMEFREAYIEDNYMSDSLCAVFNGVESCDIDEKVMQAVGFIGCELLTAYDEEEDEDVIHPSLYMMAAELAQQSIKAALKNIEDKLGLDGELLSLHSSLSFEDDFEDDVAAIKKSLT